jgi:hypothetical protein
LPGMGFRVRSVMSVRATIGMALQARYRLRKPLRRGV